MALTLAVPSIDASNCARLLPSADSGGSLSADCALSAWRVRITVRAQSPRAGPKTQPATAAIVHRPILSLVLTVPPVGPACDATVPPEPLYRAMAAKQPPGCLT